MSQATLGVSLPFLTAYDPPGTSEGSIDPMGLYQIAEQMAVVLVPAVRERMLRVRFLSAMAVGALVTEGLDGDPKQPESAPYLAWEWLVVESLIRAQEKDENLWGVPGTRVTRNALKSHGYLDARSYLKTARIFGIFGVYKRLAHELGIVDVHLAPGPRAEALADAWARGQGLGGLRAARPLLAEWTRAVQRGLAERPPRTRPGWTAERWSELAASFAPKRAKAPEKQFLRKLLLADGDRRLGALPGIWELQNEFNGEGYDERRLHELLRKKEPGLGALLTAIGEYERFARALQDGFDLIRSAASSPNASGFHVPEVASDRAFETTVRKLHARFASAYRALGEIGGGASGVQALLSQRFRAFAEPMDPAACALAICEHHEQVQRGKSLEGKRPWFDRLAADRIHLRHAYRIELPVPRPRAFVHGYRGWPIRRFHGDLT